MVKETKLPTSCCSCHTSLRVSPGINNNGNKKKITLSKVYMVWYFVAERGKIRETCSGKWHLSLISQLWNRKEWMKLLGRTKFNFISPDLNVVTATCVNFGLFFPLLPSCKIAIWRCSSCSKAHRDYWWDIAFSKIWNRLWKAARETNLKHLCLGSKKYFWARKC